MWLLDANMDVHLVSVLSDRGIQCHTAANRGWEALPNGELVKAAVSAGFDCLLTRDRLSLCPPGRPLGTCRALRLFWSTCRSGDG
jgi:hypothetical protein